MSKSNVAKETKNVNRQNNGSIEMCPFEVPTPFVLISRKLINDDSIAPFEKLYLLKILAEKPEWSNNWRNILKFLSEDNHILEMDRVCIQIIGHEIQRKNIPSLKELINKLDQKLVEVEK